MKMPESAKPSLTFSPIGANSVQGKQEAVTGFAASTRSTILLADSSRREVMQSHTTNRFSEAVTSGRKVPRLSVSFSATSPFWPAGARPLRGSDLDAGFRGGIVWPFLEQMTMLINVAIQPAKMESKHPDLHSALSAAHGSDRSTPSAPWQGRCIADQWRRNAIILQADGKIVAELDDHLSSRAFPAAGAAPKPD